MTSYETVLGLVKNVASASSSGLRDVTWMTDSHVVGVARDKEGRIEVFLSGPELSPITSAVDNVIEFRSWHRDGASSFDASRLLFPALGHFDQVAAFICTELLRAGADASLPRAFAQTEPIIELAIERQRLTNQSILGLAGELLLLDALCRRAATQQVAQIVGSWDGWKRSARDLSLGSTGIEVKTTTRSTSSHQVEGIHQVQRNDGSDGGMMESRLLLVSIGLQTANNPAGNFFTIPQLIDRILSRMREAHLGESVLDHFLAHVAEYGASSGIGYEHGTQMTDPSYSTSFHINFFRAYDMSDSAIRVLRREDLALCPHVDVNTVRFRVELPTTASHNNPISGANQAAQAILGTDT